MVEEKFEVLVKAFILGTIRFWTVISANMDRRARHILLALALFALPAVALAQTVPSELRAAILLRALRYERSFASSRDAARVVVVSTSSSGSRSDASAMADAFRKLGRAQAAGRSLDVREVTISSASEGLSEVRGLSPKVVYVAPGANAISPGLARLRGTIVLCASGDDVKDGCMMSVEVAGESSRLVIDLPQATRAGLRFDARMLRLARVIR